MRTLWHKLLRHLAHPVREEGPDLSSALDRIRLRDIAWGYAIIPAVFVVLVLLLVVMRTQVLSPVQWMVEQIAPNAGVNSRGDSVSLFISEIVVFRILIPLGLLFGTWWWLRVFTRKCILRSGLMPYCISCGYALDRQVADAVRCPECGTLNDASKWVVDGGEGDAAESRVG